MLPPKKLGRFFFLSLAGYAVLMAPWPGLERGYAYVFRNMGNVVFARFWFWRDGSVSFLDLHSPDLKSDVRAVVAGRLPPGFTPPPPEDVKDTLMVLINRRTQGSIGQLRTSSRYVGYEPIAVLIALVGATSLPWSRRGWALLWGMLLVHVFVALRVTLTLTVSGFAADKKYALFDPSAFWTSVLTRVESLVSDDPTVSFVVPVFIWFLVALRHSERSAGAQPRPQGKANAVKAD